MATKGYLCSHIVRLRVNLLCYVALGTRFDILQSSTLTVTAEERFLLH